MLIFRFGGINLINRVITGVSAVVLGILIASIPNFIMTVCPYCHSMAMKCSWAAKAEFGTGVLIALLGILLAFAEPVDIRMGISTMLGFAGVIAALVAKVLIGFYDGDCSWECSCDPNVATVESVLGAAVAVIFFINVFYLSRAKNT